ncbi:MAG: glycosyltransferase family 39 protein [Thermoanaerobaculia bacterium]
MKRDRTILAIVIFAIAKVIFHLITNDGYGFHRDELATIDDARHLAWGFVAYPPLTAFLGRLEMLVFPVTPRFIRFLPSVAQSTAIVLTALMARRLGGNAVAQWIAAIAVAIAPVSLAASSLYQYVTFDYLWWVLIAYCFVRLIDSGDPRWWLAIGFTLGLAVLTKYTIAFLIAGIAVGFFATRMQSHLKSRWFWAGVGISIVMALPHFAWEASHDFISLEFLNTIHARDVRIGRTDHFLIEQLTDPANPVTIPLWITGLIALFFSPRLRRFRILGWMAVVPFALFVIARGRSYYTAPLYPMLFAAGATELAFALERWPSLRRRAALAVIALIFLIGSGAALVSLPLAPIGSKLWQSATKFDGDFVEEVGWPELTAEVARIWSSLPADERARTAIFCGNYGEAGAIDLYGPAYGLPHAISATNSYWLRGYGDPPPQTVIVLGGHRDRLEQRFESVTLAGHNPAPFGVRNEETNDHPEIFVCRGLRGSWAELWPKIRSFG